MSDSYISWRLLGVCCGAYQVIRADAGIAFCVHSVQKEGSAKDAAVAESQNALEVSICPQFSLSSFCPHDGC